jgi:hypothetical protein
MNNIILYKWIDKSYEKFGRVTVFSFHIGMVCQW